MFTLIREATTADVPGMLKDIGIGDEKVNRATTQFATQMIKENPGISIDNLEYCISAYQEGYKDCLATLGVKALR